MNSRDAIFCMSTYFDFSHTSQFFRYLDSTFLEGLHKRSIIEHVDTLKFIFTKLEKIIVRGINLERQRKGKKENLVS